MILAYRGTLIARDTEKNIPNAVESVSPGCERMRLIARENVARKLFSTDINT
jgi:hypothetical protein